MEKGAAYLEVILKEYQRKNGALKVLEFVEEDAVGKGDNYASKLLRVKMKVLLENGEVRNLSFIVKRPPESEILLQFLSTVKVFEREIYAYSQIFPAMEELMRSYKDSNNPVWCTYMGQKESCIVLQDLTGEGFRMTERRRGMDQKHCLLTLRSLGRFHALSCVLQKERLLDLDSMQPYVLTQNIPSVNSFFEGSLRGLFKAMRTCWGDNWNEIADRLESILCNVGEELNKLAKQSKSSFNVLNHGDCWTNNILFKYSSVTGDPEELRFVDFQGCHYNSFAWDLMNFLHSSLIPDFRRNNSEKLLEEYMKSLCSTLKAYGWPKENFPSAENLQEEMRRLRYFGLLLNCTYLPSTLSEPNEGLELEKLTTNSDDIKLSMYNNEIYCESMKKEFILLAKEGVL